MIYVNNTTNTQLFALGQDEKSSKIRSSDLSENVTMPEQAATQSSLLSEDVDQAGSKLNHNESVQVSQVKGEPC